MSRESPLERKFGENQEPLRFFIREHSITGNVHGARSAMYEKYPTSQGTPEASPMDFVRFVSSKRYQVLAVVEGEKLQEAVKAYPLAQDFGRIEVLCRVLSELMQMFQVEDKTRARVAVAGEIRQYVGELRREAEPFDFEAFKDLNAMEALRQQVQRLKKTEPDLAKYVEKGVEPSPN